MIWLLRQLPPAKSLRIRCLTARTGQVQLGTAGSGQCKSGSPSRQVQSGRACPLAPATFPGAGHAASISNLRLESIAPATLWPSTSTTFSDTFQLASRLALRGTCFSNDDWLRVLVGQTAPLCAVVELRFAPRHTPRAPEFGMGVVSGTLSKILEMLEFIQDTSPSDPGIGTGLQALRTRIIDLIEACLGGSTYPYLAKAQNN